jgi:hypothetical protein
MNNDDTYNDESKYILVDRSDPGLMWNCAVSIIVFTILLFFIFMNWKPKCSGATSFDEIMGTVNETSVVNSVGGMGFSSTRVI